MVMIGHDFCDSRFLNQSGNRLAMAEKSYDLRGLKCPLPVLRTRKALDGLQAGDLLVVACTDPLAGIDIPVLVAQTGDVLEATDSDAGVMTFRIRKR
jgi:tRNA 2-thiouridine synthesizing protein A